MALEGLLRRWKAHAPTHEVLDHQEQETVREAQRMMNGALDDLRRAEASENAERERRNTAKRMFDRPDSSSILRSRFTNQRTEVLTVIGFLILLHMLHNFSSIPSGMFSVLHQKNGSVVGRL